MDTYKPLHCDLHDYLEIACLCGYTLDIELTDGQRVTARRLPRGRLPRGRVS